VTVDVLFDPLFLAPFLTGRLLAVLLALLGPYSRMRGEWLASLGVAQAAAAGFQGPVLFILGHVVGLYEERPDAMLARLAADIPSEVLHA